MQIGQLTWKERMVILEADNVNDEDWNPILKCLKDNGFEIRYADGNYMNIVLPKTTK